MASLIETALNSVVVFVVGLPDPIVTLLAGRPEVRDGQTLDPQLQLLLKLLAAAGLPRLETLEPAAARKVFEESSGSLAATSGEMARVTDRKIQTPAGDLPVRIYVPRSGKSPHPVFVYYHGGGWTIGSLDTHDAVAREPIVQPPPW